MNSVSMSETLQALELKKNNEKSFVDKILAKDDIEKLRLLMKKTNMTRSDLLELLYLVSSSEIKLYNFDERERYVMMKMFVWIREFVKILELCFDLEQAENKFSSEGKQLLTSSRNLMEHNIKFLVDLYLNISRSSLSKGGFGFIKLLENKFEFAYNNNQTYTEGQVKKPSLLGSLGGK